MADTKTEIPWVSFCMSTYKRPLILKKQLDRILAQSFRNFEIVISDNDPDCSAGKVIDIINDPRIKYFPNITNIGVVNSFNKSIERAAAQYIVMITDDDPVVPEMLEQMHQIMENYPGYCIYMGCTRVGKKVGEVEVYDNQHFVFQLLHPGLTTNLLWSSCILKKDVVLEFGGLPDYDGLHLADHVMLVFAGTVNGGVMINKMFSSLTSHDNNFSKSNIHFYSVACVQFYKIISGSVDKELYIKNGEDALIKHIERWFIVAMFSLRKYFTYKKKDPGLIRQIDTESEKILQLPFMKHLKKKYFVKLMIFNFKKPFYLLNFLR